MRVSLSLVSGGGTVKPWHPHRKTHPAWNGGGGEQGVFTVASSKHGTAIHLNPPPPPPPLRRTKQTCNGGGGTEDVRGGVIHAGTESRLSPPPNFTVASHKHSTERPRLSPP